MHKSHWWSDGIGRAWANFSLITQKSYQKTSTADWLSWQTTLGRSKYVTMPQRRNAKTVRAENILTDRRSRAWRCSCAWCRSDLRLSFCSVTVSGKLEYSCVAILLGFVVFVSLLCWFPLSLVSWSKMSLYDFFSCLAHLQCLQRNRLYSASVRNDRNRPFILVLAVPHKRDGQQRNTHWNTKPFPFQFLIIVDIPHPQ